ncbi:MAG: metallophosphoesterase, partial [Candidatus Omnitrophica bacterium]|nr:metallophosphoesterase [Candidatus Omnitrophota bacterium]
ILAQAYPSATGSWTLVIIPDTQVYVDRRRPENAPIFSKMTRWIVESKSRCDIRLVLQVGDLAQCFDDIGEWCRVRESLSVLEGQVPFVLVAGNHDLADNRASMMNQFFLPASSPAASGDFMLGGLFESGKIDNAYYLFRSGSEEFLILALEYGPRDQVLQWADQVVSAHPRRTVILLTHAYLGADGLRTDNAVRRNGLNPHYNERVAKLPGGVNDGEQIWQKLVKKHANFEFVFSGHYMGEGSGYLASVGDHGNVVHQIFTNFQMLERGGNGFLRIVEFDGETVRVKTYSPFLDQFKTGSLNEFSFARTPNRVPHQTQP